MIETVIQDGRGTGAHVNVNTDGFLYTIAALYPPSTPPRLFPFRQNLTLNGNGATIDMRVNGSVLAQNFYLQANGTTDTYITSLSIIIADAGLTLNNFGALAALTNGCNLIWESSSRTVNLGVNLKTNWDFVRMARCNPAFGAGANAFIANNVSGASEAVVPIMNFSDIIPNGIRLSVGTTDKIKLTIRDNLSVGLDQFEILAIGFSADVVL